MANVDQVVKQAIEESVNTFVRGVYAHGPANPDVSIPDEIVEWLKNDENVIASFKEQIDGDPDKWNTDRPRVCRAAFHAGPLAAFHAYANDPKVVNEDHVNAALEHISGVCEVRFGLMWIYCPRRPWPMSEKDS